MSTREEYIFRMGQQTELTASAEPVPMKIEKVMKSRGYPEEMMALVRVVQKITESVLHFLNKRLSRIEKIKLLPSRLFGAIVAGIFTSTSAILTSLALLAGNTSLAIVYLIPTLMGMLSTCWIVWLSYK